MCQAVAEEQPRLRSLSAKHIINKCDWRCHQQEPKWTNLLLSSRSTTQPSVEPPTHSQPPLSYPYSLSHTRSQKTNYNSLSLSSIRTHHTDAKTHTHTQKHLRLQKLQQPILHQNLSSPSHQICQPAASASGGSTRGLWEFRKWAAKKKYREDRRAWDTHTHTHVVKRNRERDEEKTEKSAEKYEPVVPEIPGK